MSNYINVISEQSTHTNAKQIQFGKLAKVMYLIFDENYSMIAANTYVSEVQVIFTELYLK